MKRIVAYILMICISILSFVGYAQDEPLNEFKSEFTKNKVVEEVSHFSLELQQFEDGLTDQFIIKYKQTLSVTTSSIKNDFKETDNSIQSLIDNAFSTAVQQTTARRNEIKKEKQAIYEENNLPHTSSQKYILPISRPEITEWKDGYKIVKMGQKIDPESFTNEMSDIVEYIQPDYRFELASEGTSHIELEPTDAPDTVLEQTQMPELSDTPESTELATLIPKVALIDGGVDIMHEALQGRLIDSWDFVRDEVLTYDETVKDQYYHGTHAAGIIAKTAPDTMIMPLKVFDQGKAYTSDIVNAIEYAETHGASVVNCSWGSTDNNQILKEAMEKSNMLFICAAGNNRVDLKQTPIYPACFNLGNILSVASVNDDSGLSYFSNYGDVDIAARGRDITSAWPENQYGKMSGTSMSAAVVSGAAVMLTDEPLTIRKRLLDTSDKMQHLQEHVKNGRLLNIENLLGDIVDLEWKTVDYVEDFNQDGYDRTPAESWALFSSLKNIQVAAADTHTVVLKEDGTVWNWGGVAVCGGESEFQGAPIQAVGLSNIKAIDALYMYSMALGEDGTVYTWGANTDGQLGNGTSSNNRVPTPVIGVENVTSISAGISRIVMTKIDGTVYACGVGYGYVPVVIEGLENVKEIATGYYHTIALRNDGKIYTWGKNNYGQLGNGTTNDGSVPTILNTIDDVKKIAAGERDSMVVTNDGTLYTWGGNNYGQLGNGSTDNKNVPTKVLAIHDITEIESGYYHAVAVDKNGMIFSWGNNNNGQLGIGSKISQNVPVQISGIPEVTQVSSSSNHMVAITTDGLIYTWGDNYSGQLGDGSLPGDRLRTIPKEITTATNIVKAAAGDDFTLLLKENGTVYACGYTEKVLKMSSVSPILINGINEIIDIAAGQTFCVALKEDGTVYTWGSNSFGQLGDGTVIDKFTPIKVNILSGIVKIAAGDRFALALKEDGTVYSWGNNNAGQLGDGTKIDKSTPVQVANISGVKDIVAGNTYSAALKEDGTVYTWGSNGRGVLGIGTTDSKTTPQLIIALTDIKKIAAGGEHMMALKENGKVYIWGGNYSNQICVTSQKINPNPLDLYYLSGIEDIAAGEKHSVAIKNGAVYTWGDNYYGQLGNGTTEKGTSPKIICENNKIVSIAVGNYHNICVTSDGHTVVWGNDEKGQLGTGRLIESLVPYCVANEINDTNESADARMFLIGESISDSIDPLGDIDWYYVNIQNNGNYTVSITEGFTAELYDTRMNQLNWSNGTINLKYPEKLYIKVSNSYNLTGEYTLNVTCDADLTGGQAFKTIVGGNTYYAKLADSGKLYKGNVKLTDGPVTWICTNGTGIYFNMNNAIYTIANNIPVKLINNVDAYFLVANGTTLYFANWLDGGRLYTCNVSGGTPEKISDDIGAWLYTDESYLYYYNSLDGGALYKIGKSSRGTASGEKV